MLQFENTKKDKNGSYLFIYQPTKRLHICTNRNRFHYYLRKVTDYNGQPLDSVSVMWEVTINGEETPIRMIQEIKEYFEPGEYGNAYLLFVDLEKKNNGMPYNISASR